MSRVSHRLADAFSLRSRTYRARINFFRFFLFLLVLMMQFRMPPLSTPGQPMRYQPTNAPTPVSVQRRPFVAAPAGIMPPNAQAQPVPGSQYGARPQIQNNRKRRRFADRIILPEVCLFKKIF